MKDITDVLLQKQQEILRVREEIEALRFIIPLLADEKPRHSADRDAVPPPVVGNRWPLEIPGSR